MPFLMLLSLSGILLAALRPVKVLLRHAGTGLDVGRQVPWVANAECAVEFATLQAAGSKAREFGREDLVVVLRYDSPACELALNPAYCVTGAGGGQGTTKRPFCDNGWRTAQY